MQYRRKAARRAFLFDMELAYQMIQCFCLIGEFRGYCGTLFGSGGVCLYNFGNFPDSVFEAAEKVDLTAYIWYNVIIQYRR